MSDAVSLNEEIIANLAPDAASVKAAKQLVQRGAFSEARRSPDSRWLLAHCQGSVPRPYVTKAELAGGEARFDCDCGSMKYPCKHALGLLYLAMEQPTAFAETSAIARTSPLSAETLTLAVPASGPTEPPKDEGEALWQAIFAEPEEPTHRLVYADWIDERGDSAQAQFIRVQCEIERGAEGKRLQALLKQEQQLLAKNRTKWMADVPKHLRNKVGMRGGFVGHLDVPAKTLLKYGAELFDRYPIYSLEISELTGKVLSELAVEPYLASVRSLTALGLHSTEVEVLLSGPFLTNLRHLALSHNPVGTRGCMALANWAGLKSLRRLDLNFAQITDNALSCLTAAGPAGLRSLGLVANSISDASHLAECAALAGLQSLDVSHNKLGPKATKALAASSHLAALRELDMTGNPITDQGARALAESAQLRELRTLHLVGADQGEQAIAALRLRFGDGLRLE